MRVSTGCSICVVALMPVAYVARKISKKKVRSQVYKIGRSPLNEAVARIRPAVGFSADA